WQKFKGLPAPTKPLLVPAVAQRKDAAAEAPAEPAAAEEKPAKKAAKKDKAEGETAAVTAGEQA
ncbi:MAG TPA: 30S ribosomal protein S16, partial [Pilimelia sp.]|nr:30S ribosomal protein S16 [Pilimelia sp.]